MFDSLAKALSWSALLHLLVIAVLWITQHPQPVTQNAQPKAIEAFIYQPVLPPAQPSVVRPVEVMPVESEKPAPQPQVTNAFQQPTPASIAVPAKPVVTSPPPATAPQTADNRGKKPINNSLTTDATHVIKPFQEADATMSLAERSLAIATRQTTDIGSAALQASQLRSDLRDRPATTGKVQLKPENAADNVLMVLSDGSFIEKVGDYCYRANEGANLRANIFSMKPVPCGKDKNAAMYERIMNNIGQDRR